MSFSYVEGTTTPNLAGLIDIGTLDGTGATGIRISGESTGTFELHAAPGLLDGPANVRDYMTDLPNDHGGTAGLALSGARLFAIEGMLTVPTLADVDGAVDLLEANLDIERGLQTFKINRTGWSAARQVTAQVIGDGVRIIEPEGRAKLVPDRLFTVACAAPDPRIYSVTEHTQTITTSTAVSNAGNKACPIKVRFNGDQTNPKIDLAGTSGSCRIRFAGTIPSGHYVEVAAFPASSTGVYALDDTGVNAMGTDSSYGGPISAFTARTVPRGSSSWTATNDSGAGTTVLYWRDAW